MDLKDADFKLLNYLYHHNREPVSEIAKATKLTREQVSYKIKKYLDTGLILSFFPAVNYSALGYGYISILFLKFGNVSSVNSFYEKLSKSKNCIEFGRAFGKFDLFMVCVFKDEKDAESYVHNLLDNPEISLLDYSMLKPFFSESYPLKFFKQQNRDSIVFIGENNKKVKLDSKDKEILKILGMNARARIIDIASKTGLSSEVVLYKIRRLQKEKVLLGTKIQFDMEKLGYHFSEIFLHIKNFSKEVQDKLKSFSQQSTHVNILSFFLTKPNCLIQLFHKEQAELKNSITNLKKVLEGVNFEMDLLLIETNKEKINILPFL